MGNCWKKFRNKGVVNKRTEEVDLEQGKTSETQILKAKTQIVKVETPTEEVAAPPHVDFVNRPDMFKFKHSYIMTAEKVRFLEPMQDMKDDLTACKSVVEQFFGDTAPKVIEDHEGDGDEFPDFENQDWVKINKESKENPDDKILVFMYYKGHSQGLDDLLEADLEYDGERALERGAWTISSLPNVYVFCLFDCCRRNQGRTGRAPAYENTKNLICVYRNNGEVYHKRTCKCEPWALPNMAKEFLVHMTQRSQARLEKGIAVQDIRTFRPGVHHLVRGWEPEMVQPMPKAKPEPVPEIVVGNQ